MRRVVIRINVPTCSRWPRARTRGRNGLRVVRGGIECTVSTKQDYLAEGAPYAETGGGEVKRREVALTLASDLLRVAGRLGHDAAFGVLVHDPVPDLQEDVFEVFNL